MSLIDVRKPFLRGLGFLVIMALVFGVFFRFTNLDGKLYWHDEVYTSIRAAGYTRQEIDQAIFRNRIIHPQELQKFQRPKPGTTVADTINSLATEDPQHPPVYFLIAHVWMRAFGSSLTASRTLPAVISLLALPLMYKLGLELFSSRLTAALATALLALSPFDILFAQTARQYSLLTVTVIGSSLWLLLALRLRTWKNWGLYSLWNTLGLYTHPLFSLTIIAQGIYVLLLSLSVIGLEPARKLWSNELPRYLVRWKQCPFWTYLLAVTGALCLYTPWLAVIHAHYQRFSQTTQWTTQWVDFLYVIRQWLISFTSLFFDLDVGGDNVWACVLRLPVLVLEVGAIYAVCRQTNWLTKLFILTTVLLPFLILALPDVLHGGQRSTVTRYLISCYPGVQLAVAYLLANKLLVSQWLWRSVTVLLVTGSIASCTVSAFADTWWNRVPSNNNAEVAKIINADNKSRDRLNSPLLLSDMGDEFTNTGDLISLSYLLRDNVQLLLLNQPPNLESLQSDSQAIVFRPSKLLCRALEQKQMGLFQEFKIGEIWRLRQLSSEREQPDTKLICL